MNAIHRTPSVADTHGHTLTFAETCAVLKISRRSASRQLAAGTFPVPALPRIGQSPYRFSAWQIDRYLAREMDDARRVRRAG